jgi:hypothetical protein
MGAEVSKEKTASTPVQKKVLSKPKTYVPPRILVLQKKLEILLCERNCMAKKVEELTNETRWQNSRIQELSNENKALNKWIQELERHSKQQQQQQQKQTNSSGEMGAEVSKQMVEQENKTNSKTASKESKAPSRPTPPIKLEPQQTNVEPKESLELVRQVQEQSAVTTEASKEPPPKNQKPKGTQTQQGPKTSSAGVRRINTQKILRKPGSTRIQKQVPSKPKTYVPPSKNILDDVKLWSYLFPVKRSSLKVSSVFEIIRDPKTAARGRELLQLEESIGRQKGELLTLEKETKSLEYALSKEEKSVEKTKGEIQRAKDKLGSLSGWKWTWSDSDKKEQEEDERDSKSDDVKTRKVAKKRVQERQDKKRNTFRKKEADKHRAREEIKILQKRVEECEKAITRYTGEIPEATELVERKDVAVTETRRRIATLKGGDQKEDATFGINSSKDERGLTLLMVTVLGDDVETARVCLDLGADPDGLTSEGMTAMLIASYFKRASMMTFLESRGARRPYQKLDTWDDVFLAQTLAGNHLQDWESTLKIANRAAIPVETLFEHAVDLEASEESRMPYLTEEQQRGRNWTFFDNSLLDPTFDADTMRRVVLLEKDVLHWLQNVKSAPRAKSCFLDLLSNLIPEEKRKRQPSRIFTCHRRSMVGIKKPYEVLGTNISDQTSVLFTPFVTSETEGVASVGILVWAVVEDQNTSLYKTLIESTEFLRHKVESDERFPGYKDSVMALGKDMHLLDLKSTSIYTSRPMDLFTVDVDDELDRLGDSEFVPNKRVLESDKRLAKAIFRTTDSEIKDNIEVLSEARNDMSTQLSGGAGTG